MELDATVARSAGVGAVIGDRPLLTDAHRTEPLGADTAPDEILTHRVGTPLREAQVVGSATHVIGVVFDTDHLHLGVILHHLGDLIEQLKGALIDLIGAGGEVHDLADLDATGFFIDGDQLGLLDAGRGAAAQSALVALFAGRGAGHVIAAALDADAGVGSQRVLFAAGTGDVGVFGVDLTLILSHACGYALIVGAADGACAAGARGAAVGTFAILAGGDVRRDLPLGAARRRELRAVHLHAGRAAFGLGLGHRLGLRLRLGSRLRLGRGAGQRRRPAHTGKRAPVRGAVTADKAYTATCHHQKVAGLELRSAEHFGRRVLAGDGVGHRGDFAKTLDSRAQLVGDRNFQAQVPAQRIVDRQVLVRGPGTVEVAHVCGDAGTAHDRVERKPGPHAEVPPLEARLIAGGDEDIGQYSQRHTVILAALPGGEDLHLGHHANVPHSEAT